MRRFALHPAGGGGRAVVTERPALSISTRMTETAALYVSALSPSSLAELAGKSGLLSPCAAARTLEARKRLRAADVEGGGDADVVAVDARRPTAIDFREMFGAASLYRTDRVVADAPADMDAGGQFFSHLQRLRLKRGAVVTIMLVGPPASGKTTFAAQLKARFGDRVLVTHSAAVVTDTLAAAAPPQLVIADLCNNSGKIRAPFIAAAAEAARGPTVVVLFDFANAELAARLSARNARNKAEDDAERARTGAAPPPLPAREAKYNTYGGRGGECRFVPPKAQGSLLHNTTGIVGDELRFLSAAYVVHAGAGGGTVVSEALDGSMLALSGSDFGCGVRGFALLHARAAVGVYKTPDWSSRASVTRSFFVGDVTEPSTLVDLHDLTGLRVLTGSALGGQLLRDTLLAHAEAEITLSGERLVSQQDTVLHALHEGGMTQLVTLLEKLKAANAIKGLFAAMYPSGGLMSIHVDARFRVEGVVVAGARAVLKAAAAGYASSLQIISCKEARVVADITLESTDGRLFQYSADQEIMTLPHAVGGGGGGSVSLIVDFLGTPKQCKAYEVQLLDAVDRDGAAWGGGDGAGGGVVASLPTLSGVGARAFGEDQRSRGGKASSFAARKALGKDFESTRKLLKEAGALTGPRARRPAPPRAAPRGARRRP